MFKFPSLKYPALALAAPALQFMRDDGGATAIEYALIAAGIAVAIASTILTLGSSVNSLYSSVAEAMK